MKGNPSDANRRGPASRHKTFILIAVCILSLLVIIAATGGRSPDRSAKDVFASRAATQQQGQIAVRAAVLSDDESERYFGANLADEGIQAVWLSVQNNTDGTLYYLPITTDENYFSPPEVARLLRVWWPDAKNTAVDAVLTQDAMPDTIFSQQTVAGFVFTRREGGIKFLRVGLIGARQRFEFKFILPLNDVSYAVQKVDFDKLYTPDKIEAVDLSGLRAWLEKLPCCVVDAGGHRNGDPLNIVVVGSAGDAIFPFIKQGWRLDEPFDLHSAFRSVRAFLFGSEYLNAPVSPLYVFNRIQDISLQKARNKISLRNHLRLWRAPITIDGQYVWIGQISRDIGIKFTTQVWYLTTHKISPEVDQDRYYLLQDLALTGEVLRFGFVRGVGASSASDPRTNLTGDQYVTDGLRLVVFLGTQHRTLNEIELLEWERPPQ